jgi:hypothetical protein
VRRLLSLLPLLVGLPLAPLASPASATPPGPVHPEWGAVSARDATIRQGCRTYAYGYALTPPDGDWALETFLVGPRGRRYGSGYFDTGADPLAGDAGWRLCLRSTPAGRYTISAHLTVLNGPDSYDGWLPDTTFRLRKPRS